MESDAVTTKTRESIGRYGVEVYCYGEDFGEKSWRVRSFVVDAYTAADAVVQAVVEAGDRASAVRVFPSPASTRTTDDPRGWKP
jgi:hypothetical protein